MDAGAAQGIGLVTGKTGSKEGVKVSLFEFLRDVLIASIEKGQFPAALIAIIALSMIWRMAPADVGKLVFRLLDQNPVREEENDYCNHCLTGTRGLPFRT